MKRSRGGNLRGAVVGKPTKQQVQNARGRLLPDVIRHDLDVLFVGINPSLYSAAAGHHFARPGNRFWPALHRSGLTPRQFSPSEDRQLLEYGVGLTNVVSRATARADELNAHEIRKGGRGLCVKAGYWRVRVLAFLGLTVYRTAFRQPLADVGLQPALIARSEVWVLPNPSGLNAHYQLSDFQDLFGDLRAYLRSDNR